MRPSRVVVCALVASSFLAFGATAGAATIDFEGVAPVGNYTQEDGVTHTFAGFDVEIVHGHFVDSGYGSAGSTWAGNGSDWFLHDRTFDLVVRESGGEDFSLQSFDATEWNASYAGGQTIDVVGTYSAGGTVSSSFTTAARSAGTTPAFQTFTLGAGWTGLGSVAFSAPTNYIAYDDIELQATPEPGTIALFGIGLAGLALYGRRRLGRRRSAQ